jgi:hypothetical protein
MAQAQMHLEKLSTGQILEINLRQKNHGAESNIDVMTPEELELYKGNCNEYIATAQNFLESAKSEQIKKSQATLVKKYEDELKLIEVKLKEHNKAAGESEIETSTAEVELMDGQFVFLGVVELAKYLGWSKQRVSWNAQQGKIEKPAGKMYGSERPLWTPSQAERIKEQHS